MARNHYAHLQSSDKFMNGQEVAETLEVSLSCAYGIIRKLNKELNDKGYITISGKVSRRYFNERYYGESKGAENSDT